MTSPFKNQYNRSFMTAIWLLLALIMGGCGSSDDYVFTNTSGGNLPPGPNGTLTVRLDADTGVNARISGAARSFRVTLLTLGGESIAVRTLGPREPAVFPGLADGRYKVRTVGLDTNGGVLGYFDMLVIVPQQSDVTVPTLIYTDTIPAPDSLGVAFLAITEFPDLIEPGTPFSVTAQAFDADGYPTGATAQVTLKATGSALTVPTSQATLVDGKTTFNGLVVSPGTEGAVTLQVAASGFQAATLPAIPIDSEPSQPELRLQFVTVPGTATTGDTLSPAVQVRVVDEDEETVTGPRSVTLSLSTTPTPPAGSELLGTLTQTTVNGVATFPGLAFSDAGSYALRAQASGVTAAVSATISVTDSVQPVTGDLFVGQANAILTYALAGITAPTNDIEPGHTFTNTQSTGNLLFIQPVGGDGDFWATVEGDLGDILLFNDVTSMASGTPSKLLIAESYSELLAYDNDDGRLFSAGYDVATSSFEVSIFDGALGLPNGAGPTRTVLGFTALQGIAVDAGGNRLFVITSQEVANEEELTLHVFANVDTISGDQSAISHQVVELVGLTEGVYGLFYDEVRDRLYFAQTGGNKLYALGDIATLGGSVTQPTSQAPATLTWTDQPGATFWSPWVDVRTDKLYISDYDNSRVLIWDHASALSGNQTGAPDAVITGSNTDLEAPLPVVVLP